MSKLININLLNLNIYLNNLLEKYNIYKNSKILENFKNGYNFQLNY